MKFGREFSTHLEKTHLGGNSAPAAGVLPPLPEVQVWFVAVLTGEIEKFNDFYVGKEEDLIIRFQALKEAIQRLNRERYNEMFDSDIFNEYMMKIRKDLVVIYGETVLNSYSSLNFAGLIKILKKYDKQTGAMLGNLLGLHLTSHSLQLDL